MSDKKGFYKPQPRLSDSGAKVRNVICLIYLEDLEKVGKGYGDIIAYLDSKHVQAVVSPLHDRDHFTRHDVMSWCERHIDPETGDLDTHYLDCAPYVGKPKKKHVHIGILSKSQRNAQQWTEFLMGLVYVRPSMWEKMEDFTGFVRYLAHMDSPEKAQYSAFDIHGVGGVDMSPLAKEDQWVKDNVCAEMLDIAAKKNIRSYHRFVRWAIATGDVQYRSMALGRASLFGQYFSSIGLEDRIKASKKRENDNK